MVIMRKHDKLKDSHCDEYYHVHGGRDSDGYISLYPSLLTRYTGLILECNMHKSAPMVDAIASG